MLNRKQKAFIEIYIENPVETVANVAKKIGLAPQTVYNWHHTNNNGFRDEIEKQLKNRWEEAKYMASKTMFNLCENGDFKAAKYILDYSGYAPTQKIEADIDTTITITIGNNEY